LSSIKFLDSGWFHDFATPLRFKDIVTVFSKPPLAPWIKVNSDGLVTWLHSASGGIFKAISYFFARILGFFFSVFKSEIHGFMLVMEHAMQNGWWNVWLENNFTSALTAFKYVDIVPIRLQNPWHNCLQSGLQVVSPRIFREGNRCADKLANHGHVIQGSMWSISLLVFIKDDFFRDLYDFPTLCFP